MDTLGIKVVEATGKRELKDFIYLPEKIHANHKTWLHPIYMDEWNYFNPKKNASLAVCDYRLLVAYRGGRPVGRIMGLINKKYNSFHKEHNGRFSFLETYDDREVAILLINEIETWLREKGMEYIVGPLGISDKDPQGFLIEGFDEPTVIVANCSFEYMIGFIEEAGYKKEVDLFQYKMVIPEKIPEFYKAIYRRICLNNKIRILEFKKRKPLKKFVKPIFELINEAYSDIFGFAEIEEDEMRKFERQYLPLLDPDFIKIIVDADDRVAAFIIGMPDISKGIRRARGRLFPFGILKIFRSAKRTDQVNLLLGAIRHEYRNMGLDTVLGVKMFESALRKGFKYIDSHLIQEGNLKMRAEVEKLGGEVYKKYRIYKKSL